MHFHDEVVYLTKEESDRVNAPLLLTMIAGSLFLIIVAKVSRRRNQ
jgi:hypothetical protein